MPEPVQAIVIVLAIAAVAVAAGVGFGIVVAPRVGRVFDRASADDDEEPGDRAD